MQLTPIAVKLKHIWLGAHGVSDNNHKTACGNIHFYQARGQGRLPQIVFLHGLASNAAVFGSCMTRLMRTCRMVTAPDYPGHGNSSPPPGVPDVESVYQGLCEFLDANIDDKAVLVGNSMGGAMALRYHLDRPGKTSALVLISPGGAQMDAGELSTLKSGFPSTTSKQAMDFMQRLYCKMPWYAGFIANDVLRAFSSKTVRGILDSLHAAHHVSPEELARISVPVMLMWGRCDRVMPEEHFEYFSHNLKRPLKISRPSHVGHCPQLEDPGLVCREIEDFLANVT
ncbi:MAG: alpha/beta hydrolase [Elusimicrobiota bacterium]